MCFSVWSTHVYPCLSRYFWLATVPPDGIEEEMDIDTCDSTSEILCIHYSAVDDVVWREPCNLFPYKTEAGRRVDGNGEVLKHKQMYGRESTV